jgi:hypothetical protein
VRLGVVSAPVNEIVVEPVCPAAKVFAERSVVDALAKVEAPDTVRVDGKVYAPEPNVPPVVVITPVLALYEMTEPPRRDVLEILLLNVAKSEEERYPF